MKYWPTSAIMQHLQPKQKRELMSMQVSIGTLAACHVAAYGLPACTSMAIICSENAEMRRVYLERPTAENWIALERGGFMDAFNGFGFIMDALH